MPVSSNLAVNKPVSVSSYQDTSHTGEMAVDNNLVTYWQSKKAVGKNILPSEWIEVDLGRVATITGVDFEWDAYYAITYLIRVSDDGTNWVTVFSTNAGNGGNDTIQLNSISARYIRMESMDWLNSSLRSWMREFEIMGYYSSSQPTDTPTATSQPGPTATTTPTPTSGSVTSVHVGDIDGSAQTMGKNWRANVVITIHDDDHNPVAGATIEGIWGDGDTGMGTCITDATGSCTVTSGKAANGSNTITFTVSNVVYSSLPYMPTVNHDPDGDSDGSNMIVQKP